MGSRLWSRVGRGNSQATGKSSLGFGYLLGEPVALVLTGLVQATASGVSGGYAQGSFCGH